MLDTELNCGTIELGRNELSNGVDTPGLFFTFSLDFVCFNVRGVGLLLEQYLSLCPFCLHLEQVCVANGHSHT